MFKRGARTDGQGRGGETERERRGRRGRTEARGEERRVAELVGGGIREIRGVEGEGGGGNDMHGQQSEERHQQHMWSSPSQRSSVGTTADSAYQALISKVAALLCSYSSPL